MESIIGVIGLAVMGENLALNIESKGFQVSVYNRSIEKVENFINTRAKGKSFFGALSIEDFCQSLDLPRKIILMVKAGEAVDQTIEALLPFLSKDDIIVDGGNSNFKDTERRVKYLFEKGINFVGCGISGGELGALRGPSMMPGGNVNAWKYLQDIFMAITAKVGKENEACCAWIGNGGAGHFVKTVHNGIEYGDMQLICEIYSILKNTLKLENNKISEIFSRWNKDYLESYLVEITAEILNYKEANGDFLIDKILDKAGQKGTGKWTSIVALDESVPLNLITESVFARCIAAQKTERVNLSKFYESEPLENFIKLDINDLELALFAGKLISYAQGFDLISKKSERENWGINLSNVARIWRGGCIIRSRFLDDIALAYKNVDENKNKNDNSLLFSDFYKNNLPLAIVALRKVVTSSICSAVAIPTLSSALAFYDAITCENSSANLLQAQRDYFGAHTYERIDEPNGKFFHTNWTGEGGNTSSTGYNA